MEASHSFTSCSGIKRVIIMKTTPYCCIMEASHSLTSCSSIMEVIVTQANTQHFTDGILASSQELRGGDVVLREAAAEK